MDCTLCWTMPCKCIERKVFYQQKFADVIELFDDRFWKVDVSGQIEQLSFCIDQRGEDLRMVTKNKRPDEHGLFTVWEEQTALIKKHMNRLEDVRRLIIWQDTK